MYRVRFGAEENKLMRLSEDCSEGRRRDRKVYLGDRRVFVTQVKSLY